MFKYLLAMNVFSIEKHKWDYTAPPKQTCRRKFKTEKIMVTGYECWDAVDMEITLPLNTLTVV